MTSTPQKRKPLSGRRILVVEDDRFISRVYLKWLLLAGAEALVANDGASGLKMLDEQRIDLVFLDLGMPGLNGHEMLLRIRKNKETAHIPVVILSNTTVSKGQELFKELEVAGISGILRKYETSLKEIVAVATKAFEKQT